ncbi:MAG: hypothetical protein FWD90_01005 [Defluviitaleaceae bacterium]|nr:hypothetical protein [Defluviitaleaceae bacterium]
MRENVSDLRCVHDSDCVRLTFRWPIDADHVYVFRTKADETGNPPARPAADLGRDPQNARLLTLQEYKRRGGYIIPNEPGIFTFYITTDLNEGAVESITCQTGRTTIRGTVKRKRGFGEYATHVLTLTSDYPTAGGELSYIKRCAYGAGAGDVVYSFQEPLGNVPLVRHILTRKHERLEILVADESKRGLYDLRIK